MENGYKGLERRQYKRLEVNFLVIYHIHKPLVVIMLIGNREICAIMSNLSEGGMAIETNYDIPVATILSIKFTLINTYAYADDRVKSMEMAGEVRYNMSLEKKVHRLGIHFTQIAEEDRRAIANFVKMVFNR